MQRIENVHIFTQGKLQYGTLVIDDQGYIADVLLSADAPSQPVSRLLLPGVVDAHVHFREPGLTQKADIASESRAAAAGGVTTVMDMPNVNPTTTTPEALAAKHQLYRQKCVVDYRLWYGITANNIEQALRDYGQPDSPHRDEICGFKVFLGSSTGGMLMNDQAKLRQLFAGTQRVIGIHSESEDIIRRNKQKYLDYFQARDAQHQVPTDLPIDYHPKIRDVEACMETTRMAIQLARETGAQLHVCHLTTADELQFFPANHITAEVTPAHLTFSQEDYQTLGTRIKCNPAIKRVQDRTALRQALMDGRIFSIGTDHAPHLLSDKQGGSLRAASGMPSIQYSLLSLLELMEQGVVSLAKIVELMSTHPAQRFGLADRGLIAPGKRADLVLVDCQQTTHVTKSNIVSKCGWSPFEGHTFNHRIVGTWVQGRKVY